MVLGVSIQFIWWVLVYLVMRCVPAFVGFYNIPSWVGIVGF